MTAKKKQEIIDGAIAGGIIGAALGALLTGKGKSTIISALAGAAIGASIKAKQEAKKLDVPVMYEEEGTIYRVYPDGTKELVKELDKSTTTIPQSFSIE